MNKPRAILIEMRQVGNMLRVAALDQATGREVIVSGPPSQEEALKRTAIRKLEYMLGKEMKQ
jgi:hypothetical protein